MKAKQLIGLAAAVVVAIAIAMIPAPEGLEQPAMTFLGIFVGFLICMVIGVAPDHVLVLGTLAVLLITGTTDFAKAFSPFAGTTVWLVVAGFGISAALVNCGLLKRIALHILKFFPPSFTGQVLAMLATGTVLSPFLPSVNAKAVLLAPLSAQVSKSAGFAKSSRGAGGLFASSYISAGIFGNAFFTGSLFVLVMMGFVPADEKGNWNFVSFLGMTWVWFIVLVVLSFVAIMFLYKPKEKTEFPKGYARAQLKEIGPVTKDELVCLLFLVLAIGFWIAEPFHHIDAAVIAMASFIGMCIFGGKSFTVADFGPKIPWTVVMLIGGIMSIASMLTAHKIDTWVGGILGPVMQPIVGNAFVLVLVVVILVYLLRFVVISQIATGTIIIAIFSSLLPTLGVHYAMVLAFMVFTSVQVWNLAFHNTAEIAARGATGGDMVEHKDTVKMSWAYMGINLVGLLLSVPLWIATGLIG